MKTFPLLLLMASLAMAQQPALQKDRQVLLDFRVDRKIASANITSSNSEKRVIKGVSTISD